jgi:hypothetical protein
LKVNKNKQKKISKQREHIRELALKINIILLWNDSIEIL